MKENEVGTVISTMDSPSPSKLSFVVDSDQPVHRGQFVELDYSEGTLIALVNNVIKTNRYFERADSVKEFESNGLSLNEQFPTTEWEFLVAETRPLGVFTESLTKRSTFPPSPGTKVRIASEKNLKKFFKFDEKGLNLGKVEYHDTEVKLNLTKLLQKHVAILAQSGAGKCVSPDTKILLSDGKTVEIGSLVNSVLEKGFVLENGVEYSKNNSNKLKVVSLNLNNKLIESKIQAFSRRKTPKEMLSIKTKTGKEIELTLEHKIPMLNKYINWIEAKKLKKGDFLLLPRPLIEGTAQEINFMEFWSDSIKVRVSEKKILVKLKNLIKEKTKIKEFAKKLNTSNGTLNYWLNKGIPLKHFNKICFELGLDSKELKKQITSLKLKQKSIPVKIKVDENFSKLFSYMLAEGHNSLTAIGFTNNSVEIQEDYIQLVEKVFKNKACRIKRKGQLMIYNQFLAQTLNKIGFTNSSWTKFVPEQITSSKKKVRNAFLSAFLDCDGHVSKSRAVIEWCLASKKIIEAIESMLLFQGIISIKKNKKINGKNYPKLCVSGSNYLNLLSKEFNLLIKHKQERINVHSKLKSNTNIDIIPNIEIHLKTIMEILALSQSKTQNISITNYLNRKDCPSFESLSQLTVKFKESLNEMTLVVQRIKKLHSFLPKVTEKEALTILQHAYSNGFDFNQISNNTTVSSNTARRMVRGITEPTKNVFSLAQNALLIQKQVNPEMKKINELNLNEIAVEIKDLCEKIGFEQKELCCQAGFCKQALYGYKNRSNPQYSTILNFSEKLYEIALEKEKKLLEAQERIFFLESLVNSNLFFDEITEIKKFTPSFEYVYDLMTESHNFTANGTIIHNSYFTGVLLEELLERKKEQGRVGIIILDVHGEYTSFCEPVTDKKFRDYSSKTKLVKARSIKIGVSKLSPGMFSAILPGLSAPQKRDLGRVIQKLQQKMREGFGPYSLDDIRRELSKDEEVKDATEKVLNSWFAELDSLQLFAETDSPSIEDLVEPGKMTVVDLSDIINMKKKQIIVNYFANKLFFLRRQKSIPPFLLVLEEAHQFIPQNVSKEGAIARSILETIAREGRKFGASLCLISQRPIQLSTTVLSQCNTNIILRITNPYDLKHIGESSEGMDSRSLEMITVLRVGEALILGEATGFPLFFKVRKRFSQDSIHEKSLEQSAQEFEDSAEEKVKEAREFL